MASTWRRTSFPSSIETQPWRSLTIKGKTLLVKGCFVDNCYNVLMADLGVMWSENITESQLLERSKSLNPYIEAPSSVILQALSERLLEGPLYSCNYDIKFSDNELIVSVSGPLQGKSGPEYQWNFNLTKTPSLMFKHQLVHPLLAMSVDLLRQKRQLIAIIDRKDKEIKDYKDNGAVISRKHLETVPFEESSFNEELLTTKEFETCCVDPLKHMDPSWEQLYTNVLQCYNWVKNNDEQGTVPLAGPSPSVSPSKSPRKRPLIQSPSKDVEKSRRLELERQLEDSKLKSKKKKKKLL